MEKIIFFKSLTKHYINLQNKVRENHKIIDFIKFGIVLLIFFLTIGIYGFFVNISSTKGYYLRSEMKKYEEAKFNNSIVQIEILKMEKNLWDSVQTNTILKQKKITIEEKVVYVPYGSNKDKFAFKGN